MSSDIKKQKIKKESLAIGVVLACVAIFTFYLLFLSDAVGVKVVAQIETTNVYIKNWTLFNPLPRALKMRYWKHW